MLLIYLLIFIASCLYILVGLQIASALSIAYDHAAWWRLWLVTLGWPGYVVMAILGMVIEFGRFVHGKVFPHTHADNSHTEAHQ